MPLQPGVAQLARGPNFAAFTVRLQSGRLLTHVTWVDADDDHILINTEVHRTKYKAAERDPNVTVMVWDHDDPYRFAEIRGRVVETVRGALAEAHIHTLAQKYTGADHVTVWHKHVDPPERVILRIAPDSQQLFGLGS